MILRNPATLAVSALLFLVACGGGSSKHPATIVAGNVRAASASTANVPRPTLWQIVRRWWSPEAVAQVPGITVAIINSSASALTDSEGFFRIEGNEFGPVVLQFTGGGNAATLPVTLPAGGELDLINVDLNGAKITVEQQRIHFEGPVTGVDCQVGLLQVLSGEQVAFRVRILPATTLVDQNGRTLGCGDLGIGLNAEVQGIVDANGEVRAVQIRETPPPNASPTPANFEGVITAVGCPASISVTRGSTSVEVDISSSTQIRKFNGVPLQCTDLGTGDDVKVEGTETSFGVTASVIERQPANPTPTPTP